MKEIQNIISSFMNFFFHPLKRNKHQFNLMIFYFLMDEGSERKMLQKSSFCFVL